MSSPRKSTILHQLWRISCLALSTFLVIRVSTEYFQRKSQPSVFMQDAITIPSVLICMDRNMNESFINSIESVTFHQNENSSIMNKSLEFMNIGQFECLSPSGDNPFEARRLLVKFSHRLDGLVHIFSYNEAKSELMSAFPLVVIREEPSSVTRTISVKLSSIRATRLRTSSNNMCLNYGDGQTQSSCIDQCMRKNRNRNLTTIGSWCYDHICRWPNCTIDYVYSYQRSTWKSSRHHLYQLERTPNHLIVNFQLSITFESYLLNMVAITAITISFCVMSSRHIFLRIIKYIFKSPNLAPRRKRNRRLFKKFCRLAIKIGCILMTIRESFSVIQLYLQYDVVTETSISQFRDTANPAVAICLTADYVLGQRIFINPDLSSGIDTKSANFIKNGRQCVTSHNLNSLAAFMYVLVFRSIDGELKLQVAEPEDILYTSHGVIIMADHYYQLDIERYEQQLLSHPWTSNCKSKPYSESDSKCLSDCTRGRIQTNILMTQSYSLNGTDFHFEPDSYCLKVCQVRKCKRVSYQIQIKLDIGNNLVSTLLLTKPNYHFFTIETPTMTIGECIIALANTVLFWVGISLLDLATIITFGFRHKSKLKLVLVSLSVVGAFVHAGFQLFNYLQYETHSLTDISDNSNMAPPTETYVIDELTSNAKLASEMIAIQSNSGLAKSTMIPTVYGFKNPSAKWSTILRFTINPSLNNRGHMSDSKEWMRFVFLKNQREYHNISVLWLSNDDEFEPTTVLKKLRTLYVSNQYLFVRKRQETMSYPYSRCDPSITSPTSYVTQCLRRSRTLSGRLVRVPRGGVSEMPDYVYNNTIIKECMEYSASRIPCQSESYEPIEIPTDSEFISYGPTILEFRSWTEPKSDLIDLFIEICSVLGMWFGFSLLGTFQYGRIFMTHYRQWLRCDQSWERPRIEFNFLNVFCNRMKVVKFTEN